MLEYIILIVKLIIMKKVNIIVWLSLLLVFSSACKKDDADTPSPTNYTLNGKAQKGPFVLGTTVTLKELNDQLGQIGKSFSATIVKDDGSFSLNNIALNENMALLTANGFYFSEVYGKLSNAPLSLQALSNLSNTNNTNINVLTHLIKGRVENLIKSGKDFAEANAQAKAECYAFLGVTSDAGVDFDNLDISIDNEDNAALLAFSIILQRYTGFSDQQQHATAELTELLTQLATDFADNGIIDNQTSIDSLLYNISTLDLGTIRKHIEKRYADLGETVTIPDFETYIDKFQEKHHPNIVADFTYPEKAVGILEMPPNGLQPNILAVQDSVINVIQPFAFAAITPLYSDLTIKFISSGGYSVGAPIYGWEFINEYPSGFTVHSQKRNNLMTMLFYLEGSGEATIEYYENGATTPTQTKHIRWQR